MRVAVVGAGAVGATAARHLAVDTAHEVTLYDAEGVGAGATGRAAGLVYDAYADPTDAEIGRDSVAALRAADGAGPFGFVDRPYVWFATGPGEVATAIETQVARMQDNGLDVRLVTPGTLAERYPGLAVADIEVAALAADAGYADPAAWARLQADRARAAGATVRTGARVAVETDPPAVVVAGERRPVDAVAVAAGAHTGRLLEAAGHPLAVTPYRVQALTTDGDGAGVPMLFDATAGVYARPHETGLLVGDGTEERPADPSDWRRAADDWFVSRATEYAADRVASPGTVRRSWAGLCTATPDGDPLLGPVTDGVAVATGWQGHGFMRAPETGRLLAEATVSGTAPVTGFDPRRYDGTEEFPVVEGMAVE